MRSPSQRSTISQSNDSPYRVVGPADSKIAPESEPLLSLLTTSHPWLGGTINGSLSAYTSTKSHSPRFIQYGNIGSPVANTVGTVGRKTGVEESIRRYLGERRPSDSERENESGNNKRRKVGDTDPDNMDIEKGFYSPTQQRNDSRRQSQISYAESLPAYDENRSPKYEEQVGHSSEDRIEGNRPNSQSLSWSAQLIVTTSGLGVALSESSLRSLKFCLGLLHNATSHLGNVMRALRLVLDDYDSSIDRSQHGDSEMVTAAEIAPPNMTPAQEQVARRLAERMKALSDDILQTVKSVVGGVSRYAGGALPENASALVRRQLMSVPLRWRLASESTAGIMRSAAGSEAEPVIGAHRMLAFAKEGLDMMAQVSGIVDCTIVSAERWLESLGKRGKAEGQERKIDESVPMVSDGEAREKHAIPLIDGKEEKSELSA
jgi:transcriptional repressor OPI1